MILFQSCLPLMLFFLGFVSDFLLIPDVIFPAFHGSNVLKGTPSYRHITPEIIKPLYVSNIIPVLQNIEKQTITKKQDT